VESVIPTALPKFVNAQDSNPPLTPGKGTTVRHEVFEAGAIFPSASVNRQVRCIALTPFVPLSRLRERGNALQGAPPCAPTPLSHTVGEGLGVRAKKRARLAHSELKRCTLISSPARRERGIMECGSEASAHAEANASALQTGQRAAPLSHAVGEGLGVRAESGRTSHTVNPSDVPLSAPSPPLTRGERAGSGGFCTRRNL
jgi:hypothetical protein